ncbi:acyltransferase [Rhizobium anhuiense]|uniref:Acyltransferase n=1 Tax=Rhizobium anhuiense TaxID=1184720 RepID=A0ABX4J136_9HYPH|nr:MULTISPECIES: acyltransferase family protein [Rhizobium]MBB4218434.1 peptidoglycan/LPS O-acetylase OafA/YrhL [Rhizobium sp. BK212]PDS41997.1 acyltransferase [Rhizobium anhuiense]PDS48883.1 acyltransferase [Rhizobium anhuiense]
MITHRQDIDGLRAVAVIFVILYHCGFDRILPGGFIGVDIFFVISGYLITKIILADVGDGRFSIGNFYSRRAKRILPAVVVMYAVVMAASYFTMLPDESLRVFKSVTSSALFASNAYFYFTTGYFDDSSEFNPVLHTWSLSVEEQFYVFFPLIVMLASRYGRRATGMAIAGLFAVSIIASIITVPINRSAAFYLVQYRAWELLVGALIAGPALPKFADARINDVLSAIGALLIGLSALLLSKTSEFPGLTALPATAGTALIIWTGPGTLVSKLLSLRVATAIGLISYSLYLWHWPIWVFSNQYGAWEHGWQLVPIALSLVVAYVSWRFVETPFRTMRYRPAVSVAAGAASIASVAMLAFVGQLAADQMKEDNTAVERVAEFADYDPSKAFRSGQCFLTSNDGIEKYDRDACLALSDNQQNIALVGDSHAAHLYPGLRALSGANVIQANASGCRPTLDAEGEERCIELMNYMFKDFLPSHKVDVLVLAGRWTKDDAKLIRKTVDYLSPFAKKIVVFGPVAEYKSSLPRLLAHSLYDKQPFKAADHLVPRQHIGLDIQDALAGSGATYISTYKTMCNPDCVVWTKSGDPVQFDYGHFTADGSRILISRVKQALVVQR